MSDLVHRGINEVRRQQGATDLTKHNILAKAALDHNNYQIRTDTLTHYQKDPDKQTVKERIDSFGGRFSRVGENVQYKGFPVRTWGMQREILTPSYQEAAKEIIQNWVNSPGHYRNLINPDYEYVGTAIGWNPENNAVFATQVFGA